MKNAPSVAEVRIGLRRDAPIGTAEPRLLWTFASGPVAWLQDAAEIEVDLDGVTTVHHHRSPESTVAWPFPALHPRQRGRIRVRVTGADGSESEWSNPVTFATGFLEPGEWGAEFVGLAEPERHGQPVLLRTEFEIARPVASALLYASARGVYQVEVNGREVDDAVLKPGWTTYESRLALETTDVTHLVTEGPNAIGISLGGGWYTQRGHIPWVPESSYGEQPAAAAQLVVTYDDGSQDVIRTGADWLATGDGPIVDSALFDGETFDARRAPSGWAPVVVHPVDVVPEPTTVPATRRIEELPVREVLQSPSGKLILDFGQNFAGRLRLRVHGPAGTELVIRHAEVLMDGELSVTHLRAAKATDRLILGDEPLDWEPAFTFHGFRYAEIEGWPGDFDPADVTGVVLHSDMVRTGWFESSDEMLNRFHENVVWAMRSNFLALPTDCPQRDERMGWTGDIQVFAPTAAFLYDCEGLLGSWLRDLALEQDAEGTVPVMVPTPPAVREIGMTSAMAAWGDAATIVPNVLDERFGDPHVLRAQFESMRAWVARVADLAGPARLWSSENQLGDHLDPARTPDGSGGTTDSGLIATAYLFRSASLLARAADRLGEAAVADEARALAEEVRRAWLGEYVPAEGLLTSDSQTAYALAIGFDLAPDGVARKKFGDRLAVLVEDAGYRVGTGYVGTPVLCDALTATGHHDTAGRLLLGREHPSWLYQVTMGATTVWERWDSLRPDGSLNPGEMTSFNHYGLGSVADWMHRVVAGLAPASPGYREILIAPRPIAGLDWARATHDTPQGRAEVSWAVERSGQLRVDATVPPNTTAVVRLPGRAEERVGSGTYSWEVDDPRTLVEPTQVGQGGPFVDH